MKRAFTIVFSAIILLSVCGIAFSQDVAGKRVKLIKVKENRAISTATILSKIKTKVGDIFSQDVLNDDLKRLYDLGFFTDISIDVSDYEDGIAVTFIVDEKPVVGAINFKGNHSIKPNALRQEMESKEGGMFDPNLLSKDTNALRRFYEKKGFPRAKITYHKELDRTANTMTVTINVNEMKPVKIKRIFFEGNENYPDSTLFRLITTRADAIFTSGHFKKDIFEEDLEKLKAYYQREGYLDAAVESAFEYYDDNRRVDITIKVNEGRKYLVGGITVAGNTLFTENEVHDVLEMTKNRPFSQEAMSLDAAHIQEIYYNRGYIMCRVYPEPVVNKETGRIDLTYNINEDRLMSVGRVRVSGNTKTKDVVIRRELRIYPAEPFSGERIKRSKERLYNLGYFEDISFDTAETDDPAKRDLIINVKETKTGEFSFGGGYSSIDKLIGFASVSQRNFDVLNFPTFTGGGQNLTLRGEFGFVRTNYLLSWTDPWIFGMPYSFGFDLYRTTHEREKDVGYGWEEERWGGNARFAKEFYDWLRGDLIYSFDRVKIDDLPGDALEELRREQGKTYLSSLGAYLTYDTRDNVFNPTRGMVISGGVQEAGGPFLGDVDFFKYTGRASYYMSFIEYLVLELKARGGMVGEYGDSDYVPVYERFYAGGSNSIRGYSERGVGPRDIRADYPIGGESMLVGNAELTVPLFKDTLKGAIFFDVGNVWEEMEDIGQGGYKYGAGVGIKVKTPIGPVKIDWGYPLKKIEGEKQKGRFYFSMSHGF